MEEHVYLGLGSNLGEKAENIQEALRLLAGYGEIRAVSSMYHSEPVGYSAQPWFYNAACRMATSLPPLKLLDSVQEVERILGRKKPFDNGPRTIDVDILFYGHWLFWAHRITIPHPRLGDRGFVLWPMSEIAPDFRHPLLDASMREIWMARRDHLEKIEKITYQANNSRLWGDRDV
ncbi:MAG: 2-amino-4-hydroxy-6-hydroxymethyldihydropteridine diphosphokinase [Bacillota bacterium]